MVKYQKEKEITFALLAQWTERRSSKPQTTGSTPVWGTKEFCKEFRKILDKDEKLLYNYYIIKNKKEEIKIMSTMSVTELQKSIKDSVVPCFMDAGMSNMELIQIDNYKWIVVTEVEGEQRFAEIGITAKKADFTMEDACLAAAKFAEKHEAAVQREADRAAKRAEKANAKGESRNSSGNLNKDYTPYDERYANGDF